MLQIHYKWMYEIFCSIFIEQSTMQAVIGVFSSAISTKRNNTVKCNVTYRFGQNNHFPPFPSCFLIFFKEIYNMLIYSIVQHWNFLQKRRVTFLAVCIDFVNKGSPRFCNFIMQHLFKWYFF